MTCMSYDHIDYISIRIRFLDGICPVQILHNISSRQILYQVVRDLDDPQWIVDPPDV